MPRGLLFINPRSRSGRESRQLAIKELAARDIVVDDVSTTPPGSLPDALRRSRASIDRLIVGGGDGTLNRLLESIIDLAVPVGILPLGTANDLAATLGIPPNLEKACDVIAAGNVRRIDLGVVNGKYFVNEGSLGLSTRIARDLDSQAKKRWGIWATLCNAARLALRSRQFIAHLRCDQTIHDVRTLQVTVGNGERFGGLIKSADADIGDHQLDLYSLEAKSFWDTLALLPSLVCGRYSDCPGVRLERGREIEVRTKRPLPIYTDGELTAATPALFRVAPSALSVFAPQPQPDT